jgi:exportin-1
VLLNLIGKTNEVACENGMNILKLLRSPPPSPSYVLTRRSEEIFDVSDGMRTRKSNKLKDSLTVELQVIYQFAEFVLNNASRPQLIVATLQCLLRFLSWMPLNYIFGTQLIAILTQKVFEPPLRPPR